MKKPNYLASFSEKKRIDGIDNHLFARAEKLSVLTHVAQKKLHGVLPDAMLDKMYVTGIGERLHLSFVHMSAASIISMNKKQCIQALQQHSAFARIQDIKVHLHAVESSTPCVQMSTPAKRQTISEQTKQLIIDSANEANTPMLLQKALLDLAMCLK